MNGSATLTSGSVEVIGSYKCTRLPASSYHNVRLLNTTVEFYGLCAYVFGSTPQNANGVIELHFAPDSDLEQFQDTGALESVRWSGGGITAGRAVLSATPESSTRFSDQATTVLKYRDNFCYSLVSDGVFCQLTTFSGVSAGASASLVLSVSGNADTFLTGGGIPTVPDMVEVNRNASFDEVVVSWDLPDPVSEYQVNRLSAVQVTVGDTSRIEYGDPETFRVDGTIEGVDSYTDAMVEPGNTYQYRVRARGGPGEWSSWSAYVFSGSQPGAGDLEAPSNVRLDRADDNSSVTVEWSAPGGDFDNYTVQCQELVVQDSSTFFANAVTLGSPWLPTTSLEYEDRAILPGQTYEYRVAAVKDDLVGEYTDWARSSPAENSLGIGPENLRYESTGSRILAGRREFWLRWDEADGADDYEVDIQVYDVARGVQQMERRVVTDPTIFWTSYGRVGMRVRSRKADAALCGSQPADRCLSDRSPWYEVRFTPRAPTISPAPTVTPTRTSWTCGRTSMRPSPAALGPPALPYRPGW